MTAIKELSILSKNENILEIERIDKNSLNYKYMDSKKTNDEESSRN